jgi:DNA polymerase III subunit alpha
MSKIQIDFVQLHDHSCMSRRDAHSRIDKLVAKAKENGQRAIGLTDHGVLHGIPQLFNEAKKQGIKAIAGFEGYFAPTGRETKDKHFHQVIFAKNKIGFSNMSKLSSEAFMTGFHGKPRFDWELLLKYKEGLILTSSCLAGQIPQAILNGEYKEARVIASKFKSIFGEDFYLEIQPTPTPAQKMVNTEIIKMAEELDIEIVATGDVHYVEKEDQKAHIGMLCLGRNKKMHEEKGYDGEEHYWLKPAREVAKDFLSQGYDRDTVVKAMNNTGVIANKCDFVLEKEKDFLPEFPLPEGYTDKDKLLGDMVKEGLMRKVPIKTKTYIDRLKFELGVIREKGYQDYFLIVSDAIKFAKSKGIMVAPGRGSGAGSLVAFLLDITEVDPIIHGLFFERFLDITRSKMPDIDTDIEDERRYEVLNYLKEKYGWEKVSQIVNYGKMTAKLAFKNALMVYDIPFGKAQEISNLVPDTLGITIEEAYRVAPELKAKKKETVKDNRGETVKLAEVFDLAERFEGVVDKLSKHAGGILITPDPIANHFPVFGNKEEMVTQWDKDDLENLGGVKFDFLGLKTLRMIGLCIRSIKAEHGKDIDVFELARLANDPKVYERITEGKTENSFQFNSSGMQQLCKAVKPTEFAHLVAINALYRPPALASGDTWRYARIKNGQEVEHYSHPEEKAITGETFGVITYQEHVMQLVHHFAGWDYGRGDKLRKASQEALEGMRDEFISDSGSRGYDAESMNEIWSRIVQYMGYGFNKSHGVAYTMISYITVWLEAHYPEHWQSAIMTVKMGEQDKIAQVFAEIKRQGFEFQAPDINLSGEIFTANKGRIVFPLGTILGVGDKAVQNLLENKPFKSLEDLMARCNLRVVSARAMKPLILAGAFDSMYPELNRKEVLIKYYEIKKEAKKTIEKVREMEWNDNTQAEYEKELLGVYITKHPMDKYHFRNWSDWNEGESGVLVGGRVSKVKSFNDKNGNRMAFASIETLEGVRELVVFASSMKKVESFLKKGVMIMVDGKKDGEKLIVNKVKELK